MGAAKTASGAGHGNYMAGQIDGVTVEAANGRPIPFRQIGTVEFV